MSDGPASIPVDDLSREVTIARPDTDESLTHVGLVGTPTRSFSVVRTPQASAP
jgi:hypothetical protein